MIGRKHSPNGGLLVIPMVESAKITKKQIPEYVLKIPFIRGSNRNQNHRAPNQQLTIRC